MPYIVKPRRTRRVALTSFVTTLAIGALPAVANAECPSQSTSLRFQSSGDTSEYFPVPGGTFEEGAPGWSLDNASLTSDSEGPEGSAGAVVIQPGGSATSPPFCVSSAYPSFRFFARQLSGKGGLTVRLRWRSDGWIPFSQSSTVATLGANASWVLSPALELASKLPLSGGTLNVQLVFETERGGFLDADSGATWAIDDVYVDPYRR